MEQSAVSQLYNLLNQEFVHGRSIRIMPDVHAGVGCTVGTAMTVGDKVAPSLVGMDIGCGMEVVMLTLGSGNHFIELGKDEDGKLYIVVHSGSRNLGKQTAEYYQNAAIKLR